MKILHVISSPTAGGAETYVKDLAKELVGQGHEVHIGFLGKAEDTGRSIDFENRFLAELESAGIRFFFIGHRARRYPWLGVLRVRSYVIDNTIEIYHSHLTYGVIFGALSSVPRIYTHHSAKMRVRRVVFRLIGRWAIQLVGISNLCASSLSNYSGRKVTVIFNGVDRRKLTPTQVFRGQLPDVMQCICVGRVSAPKNYELLVRAIALLPVDTRSRLNIAIAGEGSAEDMDSLNAEIVKHGLHSTVRLLGNRSDVPLLLSKSHLFLMSSAWEGLPIALIEAALSGLPCIVTDVGGCREVIDTCRNGLVVVPDNAQALADAIESLVRVPAKLSEYSINALKNSSVFSIEQASKGHLDLYEKLLKMDASTVNS